MQKKRKYTLSTLPDEAKTMLSLDEKILFDQTVSTLSSEDQLTWRNARAKISKFMHARERNPQINLDSGKQVRLNYHQIPECIWTTLSLKSSLCVEECKNILQTPPRNIGGLQKRRISLGAMMRHLVQSFFYSDNFFNIDCVLDFTWTLLEKEIPNGKFLVMTHPCLLSKESDRRHRRMAMKTLQVLFKEQPQTVMIVNFKILDRPVTI